MKNTKNAVIYGVVGGVAGFGISKLAKTSHKWAMVWAVVGAVVGGVVGNNS